EVDQGKVGRSATLGLGPLRLAEIAGDDRSAATRAIDAALDGVAWLGDGGARREVFYPVGGAWRTLARVHIAQHDYPLHIIHGYRLAAPEAIDLARVVSRLGSRSTARFKAVSRKRAEIVPLAALVLERVLKRVKCRAVVFSSTGLREGQVYDLLSKAEQARDPLLAAAAEIGARESRFGDLGLALLAWSEPLFPEQSASERRLRQAACHLSDLAWRDHPDYRAELALARVLRLPLLGLDHPERCYLALALHARYGGEADDPAIEAPKTLLTPEQAAKARALGLAIRLAYSLSGATESLLKHSRLRCNGGKIGLDLPDGGAGDTVERRLKALASALDLKAE
ncbi:MAG: Ppx/GppA family phosphatase, partial [Kiloniellales bacterium]